MYINEQALLEAIGPEIKAALGLPQTAAFCAPEALQIVPLSDGAYIVIGYLDAQGVRTPFQLRCFCDSQGWHSSGIVAQPSPRTPRGLYLIAVLAVLLAAAAAFFAVFSL